MPVPINLGKNLVIQDILNALQAEPEEEPEEPIQVKRKRVDKKQEASDRGAKAPEAKRAKEGAPKKSAQKDKWQYIGDGNLLVCEVTRQILHFTLLVSCMSCNRST